MLRKNKTFIILASVAATAIAVVSWYFLFYNTAAAKLARQVEQAPEIKDRYQLDNASLKRTVKDDPKDRIEIQIGKKDDAEFSPSLKIARWDDEVSLSVKPKALEGIKIGDKDLKFEGDKIKFETPNIDYHLYEITEGEGGYEFEVILKEKPTTNKIEFSLQTKGLDFFYQPPLNQEVKIGEGGVVSCTEIQCFDKDGKVLIERPENVVGSYAVYYQNHPMNIEGGKLYRTGKFGHIFRPKMTDAKGDWIWEELDVDKEKGFLTITIPQDFLDRAVYPISSKGTTFGNLAEGGTAYAYHNKFSGGYFPTTEAGNVTKISVYHSVDLANNNTRAKWAIYSDAATLTLLQSTSERTFNNPDTNPSWQDFTLLSTQAVTASTYYHLIGWGESGQNGCWPRVYRDSGGGGGYSQYTALTYIAGDNDWPTTVTKDLEGYLVSIYATYTAAASCGDGTCNGSETCATCGQDCGSCPPGAVILKPGVILKRNVIFGRPAPAASCSSPSCPTTCKMTATEAFENGSSACGTGGSTCINTWAVSGTTVTVENSPAGASEGTDCSQSMKFVVNEANVFARWDNGATIDGSATNINVVFYLYVDTATIAPYGYYVLVDFNVGSTCDSDYLGKMVLRNGDPTYGLYVSADTNSAIMDIAFDTWYLVTIHYDTTAANSYISLAGSTACAGGAADTATCKKFLKYDKDPRYLCIGAPTAVGAGKTGTIYYGYTYVSTP